MMCFDEIKIGDLLRAGLYGYKVLNKKSPDSVTVQTVCFFASHDSPAPAKIIGDGEVYVNVAPDCFSCRYVQKAVVV